MSDVFISYSRKDIQFAQRIHQELEARDREPWVDWQDIPPTSEWLDEVYAGIQAAIEYGPARIPHRAIEAAVQPLRDIRDKVGMDLDILVDGHAHFQLPRRYVLFDVVTECSCSHITSVVSINKCKSILY